VTFQLWIAAAFAVGVWVLLSLQQRLWSDGDLEDLSPIAQRIRALPWPIRGGIEAVLYFLIGVTGEAWLTEVLLPAIDAGGAVLAWTIARDVLAGGLAISFGRQLTSREFSAFGGGDGA